jgi:DNA end-binding protein Ku
VDRSELIRGYEIDKDVFVTFTEEELEKLEAADDRAINIVEFLPLAKVDPVWFESSYHLGCSPESARAYRLLAHAMESTQRVAVARYPLRNREHVVLLRPYEKGLMMHTLRFADEVVDASEADRGAEAEVSQQELNLAKRLIGDLVHEKFDPSKFKDSYRERVVEAAREKLAGHEAITPQPEVRRAKVINLFDALKASLEGRGVKPPEEQAEEREAVGGKARRPRSTPQQRAGKRR